MRKEEQKEMMKMSIWVTVILIVGFSIMISFAIAQKNYFMLLYFLLVLIPVSLLWGGSAGVLFLERIKEWRIHKGKKTM